MRLRIGQQKACVDYGRVEGQLGLLWAKWATTHLMVEQPTSANVTIQEAADSAPGVQPRSTACPRRLSCGVQEWAFRRRTDCANMVCVAEQGVLYNFSRVI